MARGKDQIFKQALQVMKGIAMGQIKGSVGLRLNRYFVKFKNFRR